MAFFFGIGAPSIEFVNDWLAAEAEGFALDATVVDGKVLVKDIDTPGNNLAGVTLNRSNILQTGTSPKLVHWNNAPYVRWAPHNLIRNSQVHDSGGAAWSSSSQNETTGEADPFGGTTAWKHQLTGTSGSFSQSATTVGGVPYTMSFWWRAGTAAWFRVYFGTTMGSIWFSATSPPVIGTIDAGMNYASHTLTDYGNGWYRVAITFAPDGGSDSYGVIVTTADAATAGVVGENHYLYGVQLNRGPLTEYVTTGATATPGIPLAYDNSTGQYGILVESAATNLQPKSEAFDAGEWTKQFLTVSANTADTTGPDGYNGADKLTATAVLGTHWIWKGTGATTTASTNYTASCYVKMGTNRYIVFAGVGLATSWYGAVYDLITGTVTSSSNGAAGVLVSTSITAIGDSWYRITLTGQHTHTTTFWQIGILNTATPTWYDLAENDDWTPVGTETIYVWGAQLELGNIASSYIPNTTTSTVTRAKDLLTAATSTLPYSDTLGTVYFDGQTANGLVTQVGWGFDDGTANERTFFYRLSDGTSSASITDGAVTQASFAGTLANNVQVQEMLAWGVNDVASSMSGDIFVDTTATLPTVTNFRVGCDWAGNAWNGFISHLVYLPRRMSNIEMMNRTGVVTYDSGAMYLLGGENEGFAIDATEDGGSVAVVDIDTVGNNLRNVLLANSNLVQSGTSPKLVQWNSAPYVRWTPHNILLQSQTHSTSPWTVTSITLTSGQSDPAGGTNAFLHTVTSTSSDFRQSITYLNVIYTLSFYWKAGTQGSHFRVSLGTSTVDVLYSIWFTSTSPPVRGTTGASTGHISTTITDVGSGWYRIVITFLHPGGANYATGIWGCAGDASTAEVVGDNYYLFGFQLNQGSTVTSHLVTTTTARIGIPQAYDPYEECFGVLVEPAATNLVQRSESFNDGYWTKSGNASVTADTVAAPDGSATADTYNTGTPTPEAIQSTAITVTASTVYTVSVYVKYSEAQWIRLQLSDTIVTDRVRGWFDIQNGVVGSSEITGAGAFISSSITSVGNGWYRIAMTGSIAATSGRFIIGAVTANASSTYASDVDTYLWGAQVEAGSAATSYIPTIAASVTRAVDQIGCAYSVLPYNNTTGTFYVKAKNISYNTTAVTSLLSFDGGATQYARARITTTGLFNLVARDNNVDQANISYATAVSNNTLYEGTCTWATDDYAVTRDGGTPVTDVSGPSPVIDVTTFNLGQANAGVQTHNGYIYQMVYVPRRVS